MLQSRLSKHFGHARPRAFAVITAFAAIFAFRTAPGQIPARGGGSSGQADVLKDILARGWSLKPDRVAELEAKLRANPADVDSRALLMSYYFQQMNAADLNRHTLWLIKNDPGSPLLSSAARFSNVEGLHSDTGAWEQAAVLWRDVIKRDPRDVHVLSNAAWFFEPRDLATAESLRLKIGQLAPKDRNNEDALKIMYSRVLSTSMIKFPNGRPPFAIGYHNPEFATRVASQLLSSDDARLLRDYADRIDPERTIRGSIDATDLASFVRKLRERADVLDPDRKLMPEGRPVVSPRIQDTHAAEIRSDATVSLPYTELSNRILKRVEPAYPDAARNERIAGTVTVPIVIATNGSVKEVGDATGPPALAAAAKDAVRQWVFEMTLVDNIPREVRTAVPVEFKSAQ